MFRIENDSEGRQLILRLSGRIDGEHLPELKAQIESSHQRIVVDLRELKLVDRDVVQFLAICESKGIELRYCAPYIREWIERES
jgi:anti-anti-sigma regulatory factor